MSKRHLLGNPVVKEERVCEHEKAVQRAERLRKGMPSWLHAVHVS